MATFFHLFWSAYLTCNVTFAPGAAGLTEPLILTLLPCTGSVSLTVAVTVKAPALADAGAWWRGAASAEARTVALLERARTSPAVRMVFMPGLMHRAAGWFAEGSGR